MPELQQTQSTLRSTYTVATMEVPQDVFDLIAGKLRDAGYGHAFMEQGMVDLSGVALVPSASAEPWQFSKDRSTAVGKHLFMPIDANTPRSKCLLLGPGRTCVEAIYDGDPQWTHWFPLPDVPEGYIDPYWTRKAAFEAQQALNFEAPCDPTQGDCQRCQPNGACDLGLIPGE